MKNQQGRNNAKGEVGGVGWNGIHASTTPVPPREPTHVVDIFSNREDAHIDIGGSSAQILVKVCLPLILLTALQTGHFTGDRREKLRRYGTQKAPNISQISR